LRAGNRTKRASSFTTGLCLQRFQNLVLLRGGGGRKFGHAWKHFMRASLQYRQTFGVFLLIVFRKSDKCAVDEKNNSSFARAWRVRCGNDTSGDGVDLIGLFGRKIFKLNWRR